MAKLYDIAVVTGTYTDSQGQTKKRYQNVGAVMEGQEGGQFIMLNAWFNPAGIPRKEGSESVLLSCFVPRDNSQPSASNQGQQQSRQQSAPKPQNNGFEDDIPF